MKTINLQHKIQVKIENKVSKDAFIRQNILNKIKKNSNPRQQPLPRNMHPHSFGEYPICPLRAEKMIFHKRVFYLTVITNFD